MLPKAQQEMEQYLKEKYPDLDNIEIEPITYQSNDYQMKIVSNKNKNLYFYINKKNKKITDTYQKDYLEGNTLFKYLKDKIEKDIKTETNTSVKVSILSTLDQYTTKVHEQILQEDNLLQLKFYIIEKEIIIADWTSSFIEKQIKEELSTYHNKNITPKSYTIIITNQEDITESIEIKNINSDTITKEIIQDILDDNYSKRLKDNKIKYNYLYKED